MQWTPNKDHSIYRPINHNSNTLVIVETYCVSPRVLQKSIILRDGKGCMSLAIRYKRLLSIFSSSADGSGFREKTTPKFDHGMTWRVPIERLQWCCCNTNMHAYQWPISILHPTPNILLDGDAVDVAISCMCRNNVSSSPHIAHACYVAIDHWSGECSGWIEWPIF